jgi:hypothetical protein
MSKVVQRLDAAAAGYGKSEQEIVNASSPGGDG